MRIVFPLVLAAAAAFVWSSSGSLPDVVASHFGSGGAANGFMPRVAYVAVMLVLVVFVPGLLHLLGWLSSRLPVQWINVPNRRYWLAPERREATVSSFGKLGVWASYATLALLSLVHWLVVRANSVHPSHLEEAPLVGGVAVYLVALLVGVAVLLGRFFRVP